MTTAKDPLELGPQLVACPRCKRQWDATDVPHGERLRCSCGELFQPELRAPHSPRVFRCSHCGGALPAEGRECSYCAAQITLEERGLSGVCPGCSSRLLRDARFCMECGLAIQPQSVTALREGVTCPRCRGTLRLRELAGRSAIECASCAGLWITPESFEALCARAEREDLAACALSGPVGVQPAGTARREGYIPCVTCGEPMLRKNFGSVSGVLIDSCKKHGVWFDHRELERVLAFVRSGGLLRAREREITRLEHEAERAAAQAAGAQGPSLFDGGASARGGRDLFGGEAGDLDLLDVLAWLGKCFGPRSRRRWS